MNLNQPGQIKVWIWLCPDCGRAVMAPRIAQDCKVYCPICRGEDIIPHNILIWMAGRPRGMRDLVNFLMYNREPLERMTR